MTSNVLVPEGIALTIEPGVTVLVQGYYGLQVAGKLVAEGSSSSVIVLTRLDGQWQGVEFVSATSEQTASRLVHVRISGAFDCIAVNGTNNVPTVAYAVLEKCDNGYMMYRYTSVPVSISHTLVVENFSGIRLRIPDGGSVAITDSTIINNHWYGIDASIVYGPSRISINHNNIYGNVNYNLRGASASTGTDQTIDATDNWWGTSSESEIEPTIFDCNDDLTVGCVTIQPFAMAPIADAP